MSRPFEDPQTGLTGSFFCGKDGTRRMQINASPRTVKGVGFIVLDDRMVAYLFGVILEEARGDQQRGGFAGQEGRSLAPLVTRTPQSAVTAAEAWHRGYCRNDDCQCYGDDGECPRDDCDWPSAEPEGIHAGSGLRDNEEAIYEAAEARATASAGLWAAFCQGWYVAATGAQWPRPRSLSELPKAAIKFERYEDCRELCEKVNRSGLPESLRNFNPVDLSRRVRGGGGHGVD